MVYYLPTTMKLLQAYIELDRQPSAGENIVTTKQEIREALGTINIAFENLLDGLFQDMAWDISSDISAFATPSKDSIICLSGDITVSRHTAPHRNFMYFSLAVSRASRFIIPPAKDTANIINTHSLTLLLPRIRIP
jgi:hypothetical protein